MIDGVLVDQPKAKEAYSDKVRRGVDPGLAEVGRDNSFSTRVFPIFPGRGRTIRVRFATPIDPREGYALPLRSAGRIGAVRLTLRADGAAATPTLAGAPLDVRWVGAPGAFTASAEARDVQLADTLRIGPPSPSAPPRSAPCSS